MFFLKREQKECLVFPISVYRVLNKNVDSIKRSNHWKSENLSLLTRGYLVIYVMHTIKFIGIIPIIPEDLRNELWQPTTQENKEVQCCIFKENHPTKVSAHISNYNKKNLNSTDKSLPRLKCLWDITIEISKNIQSPGAAKPSSCYSFQAVRNEEQETGHE